MYFLNRNKVILRISGYPKLNFFENFLVIASKIFKLLVLQELMEKLKILNLFSF